MSYVHSNHKNKKKPNPVIFCLISLFRCKPNLPPTKSNSSAPIPHPPTPPSPNVPMQNVLGRAHIHDMGGVYSYHLNQFFQSLILYIRLCCASNPRRLPHSPGGRLPVFPFRCQPVVAKKVICISELLYCAFVNTLTPYP